MDISQLPDYIIEGGKFVLLGVGYHLTKEEYKKVLENNTKYEPYRKYINYVEAIGINFDQKLWEEEVGTESFLANRYFDEKYRDLINRIAKDPHFAGEPEYLKSAQKINEFIDFANNSITFEDSKRDPMVLIEEWRKGSLALIQTFFTNLSKLFGLLKKEKQFKDDLERDSFLNWLEGLTQYFTAQVKEKYPELLPE
ncbi:hypothetical protein [Priestia aryabhattai]|uniref:hypothetical protein n=1 Tax=Priestia aryabhattai TaxID=412384 RepID=UPI001CCF8866|nr:hypothetical protein [Priestia aryabhattai]MBZ6485092.1 hypothetical protein [Priestia aryabhattai]